MVQATQGRSTSGEVRGEYFRSVLLTYTKNEECCILGDMTQHKIPPHTIALLITLGGRKAWLCGRHLQAMVETYQQLSERDNTCCGAELSRLLLQLQRGQPILGAQGEDQNQESEE